MDPAFVKKTTGLVKKNRAANTSLKKAKTARSVFLHINRNIRAQYTVKSHTFWNTVDITRDKLMYELKELQTTEKCPSNLRYYKIVQRTLELYIYSRCYKKSIALSLNTKFPGDLCANIMEYI